MANRNASEDAAFALGNVGVMLRTGFLALDNASSKKINAAERAALARIRMCLVQADAELNRLQTRPAQHCSRPAADVLSFESARSRNHGHAPIAQ